MARGDYLLEVRHTLSYKGLTLTLQEWVDKLGIHMGVIENRIKMGYSDEDVLTTAYKYNGEVYGYTKANQSSS